MSQPVALNDFLTVLRVEGEDAQDFLHRQLTVDVMELADGTARYGAWLDARGRVISTLVLWSEGDVFFLLLPTALAAPVGEKLKLFVLRSRVRIVPDERPIAGVVGAGEEDAANALELAADGESLRLGWPGRRQLLLGTAGVEAREAQERWKVADLRAGLVWLDAASSGRFIPAMLDLDRLQAVDYRKGCFPGQEVVARARYLGKVKRELRFTVAPFALASGETLLDAEGQTIAEVAQVAGPVDERWFAQVVVRLGVESCWTESGRELSLESDAKSLADQPSRL